MNNILHKKLLRTYGEYSSPEIFSFHTWTQPKVSLIIPVYNKYEMTKDCLWSILQHTKDVSYEVIIADDCSTDETKNIENKITGIKHIRTKENSGFGANCTNAIQYAEGKYIALLNNDMLFYDNWLKPIIDTLENDSTIGAAGGTLINPNGKVSELGGLIWGESKAIRIGRDCTYSPKLKKLNTDFDYKSGCCLVLEKTLWDKVGGFDPAFNPAYYEDTDLCFKIRELGFRIVNVFESQIIHFETVSYGDKEFELSEICRRNGKYFFRKWQKLLNNPDRIKKIEKRVTEYQKYQQKEISHRLYYKEKLPNGRRNIYVCGLKVFSYKKKRKMQEYEISEEVILKGNNQVFKEASVKTQFPNSIVIGKGTRIGQDVTISNYEKNGLIKIGENCQIGWNNNYYGQGGIEIGNNVLTASFVCILTSNHGWQEVDLPIMDQPSTYKKVVIGDDCWIGYNVIILAGVHIGKHVTVGAGSVVTKDLPDYSICAGNPCRVIKKYNFNTKKWEKVS